MDLDAARYSESSRLQRAWGEELVQRIEVPPEEVNSVLDLGCGDGGLTSLLATKFERAQVTGLDLSSNMIRFATARYASGRLRFVEADMQFLGSVVSENSVDLVFSNSALHWASNQEETLEAVEKALRPGGRLYARFPLEGHSPVFREALLETVAGPKYARYFSRLVWPWATPSYSQVQSKLKTLGFALLECKEEHYELEFQGAEEMQAWVECPCMAPFVKYVPVELVSDLIEEVSRRTLRSALGRFGTLAESFPKVLVVAVR